LISINKEPSRSVIFTRSYFYDATKHLFSNKIILGSILHSFILCLAYAFIANTQIISVPGKHAQTKHAVPENFCGQYITNFIYQAIFVNTLFAIGAIYYLLVLKRVTAINFYKWVFPLKAAIILLFAILLLTNLPKSVLSLAVGISYSVLWFLFMYDTYFVTAAIDKKYYGYFSFVNGYILTLSNFATTVMFYLKVDNYVMLMIMYIALFLSIIFSIVFYFSQRKQFLLASNEFCSREATLETISK